MRKLIAALVLFFFCSFANAQKALPSPKNTPAPSGHLVTVLVTGTTPEQSGNIKAILQLNDKSQLHARFHQHTEVRLEAQTMRGSIFTALKPYGYFSPTIKQEIVRTNDGWTITNHIQLGKPVLYHTLSVKIIGSTFPPAAEKRLKKEWPIERGKPFTLKSYNRAKTLLTTLANDYGFFSRKMVSAQTTINQNSHTADVAIVFYLGKRYRFGNTTFNPSRLSKKFLHRFLVYKKNEPYQQTLLDRTRVRFQDSQYFSSVNLAFESDKTTGYANITTTLKQLASSKYSVGAGYGTDSGVRGLFTAAFNDLNPHGDKFKLLLRGSLINSAIIGSYIIPGSNPPRDHYAITGELSKLDEIPGNSLTQRLGVSYANRVGNWNFGAELSALKERFDMVNLPKTQTSVVFPRLHARYIKADNMLFPSQAFSFSLVVSGANKSLLSHISFGQYNIRIKTVQTFWDRVRVLLGTNFAYTDIRDISQLPLTLQLMTGGVHNIRGYSFNSIFDGRELFTGSAEIQLRVTGNWYIAGFYDAGNVSNDVFSERMHVGAGPAIMWASPMGAFEISAARTISQKEKVWRIQVSMGTHL
jgi:translocation and assembly module TamA